MKVIRQISYISAAVAALFATPAYAQNDMSLKSVVIDAGHGGKDSGALGRHSMEKDIVLDVSHRVVKLINDSLPSVNTIMTRHDDTFVELKERAAIANRAKADVFISIHANATKSKAIAGVETFTLGLHRQDDNFEVAKRENSVIELEEDHGAQYDYDPEDTESLIAFSLLQSSTLDHSQIFAKIMQDELVTLNRINRDVKQDGFLVLRQTYMPSILVELGFITNQEEEKYLMSDKGKDELSYAIFKAFRKYKIQFDASSNVTINTAKPVEIDYNKGMFFGIQILSQKNELKPEDVDRLKQAYGQVKVFYEKRYYKYAVALTTDPDKADEQKKALNTYYPGCFVIAIEDGEKTDVKVARKKVKENKSATNQ